MSNEPHHFTQILPTVIQPGVVSALFRAVLILSVFIQPTICNQSSPPGYTDVVGGTTDK